MISCTHSVKCVGVVEYLIGQLYVFLHNLMCVAVLCCPGCMTVGLGLYPQQCHLPQREMMYSLWETLWYCSGNRSRSLVPGKSVMTKKTEPRYHPRSVLFASGRADLLVIQNHCKCREYLRAYSDIINTIAVILQSAWSKTSRNREVGVGEEEMTFVVPYSLFGYSLCATEARYQLIDSTCTSHAWQ